MRTHIDALKLDAAIKDQARARVHERPLGFVADDIARESAVIYRQALVSVLDALLIFGNDEGATVALARASTIIGANPRDMLPGLDGAKMPVLPLPLDTPRRRSTDPRDAENYTGAEGWTDANKAGSLA